MIPDGMKLSIFKKFSRCLKYDQEKDVPTSHEGPSLVVGENWDQSLMEIVEMEEDEGDASSDDGSYVDLDDVTQDYASLPIVPDAIDDDAKENDSGDADDEGAVAAGASDDEPKILKVAFSIDHIKDNKEKVCFRTWFLPN